MAEAKAFKMIPHCTKDTTTYEMEELVMCKDCKNFELFDGVFPVCRKWGNGCATEKDGFCYLAELK